MGNLFRSSIHLIREIYLVYYEKNNIFKGDECMVTLTVLLILTLSLIIGGAIALIASGVAFMVVFKEIIALLIIVVLIAKYIKKHKKNNK